MNNQSENNYIIPNIAAKIKDLSATKLVYLKIIIQMYPLLNDSNLAPFAHHLIRLLQNMININENPILTELEDGLTSIMITYIFDMNELLKGQLNLEKYEPRHKNLVAVHQKIDYHIKQNDLYNLGELKETLLLI